MKSSFIITMSGAKACYGKTDSQVSTEQAPNEQTQSSSTLVTFLSILKR